MKEPEMIEIENTEEKLKIKKKNFTKGAKNKQREKAGKLTQEENRDTGVLGSKYYKYYLKSAGGGLAFWTFLFFTLAIIAKMTCDFWVGQWAEDKYGLSQEDYIIAYGQLGAATLILMIFRAVFLGYFSKNAAINIFQKVVWNILRRPLSFFDTTPSGVIINRCTSDVDTIDYLIPWMMGFFLNMAFNFIGAFALTAFASPIVLIFILISILINAKGFKKFLTTSTELKRMMQISMSPVISTVSEVIEGATLIRSYRVKGFMEEKFRKRIDHFNVVRLHDEVVMIWMRVRIEFGLVFVVIATIFSVVLNKNIQ